MPGALNIPYETLLNENGLCLLDNDTLKTLFAKVGVDINKKIITSCGSGVTAAIVNFALIQLGVHSHILYDGSWAEWGLSPDSMIINPQTE